MEELTTKELLKIIDDEDIKYLLYTNDCHYETVYFLNLYHDKNKQYLFNDNPLNLKFEVRSSEKQIKELMKHFNINKKMFSCVYYKIN